MRVRSSHLIKPIRWKHRIVARVIHSLATAIGATWRLQIKDASGISQRENPLPPVIWIFWHNRVLAAPMVWRKCCPHRSGAVLTSASEDGAILAETMRLFGAQAVRGSSSKRGGAALLELEAVLKSGGDVVITPDGPRGPRYSMGVGASRLALKTGAAVQPVRFEFTACWRLPTWDGFAIPKPFSVVQAEFAPLVRAEAGEEVESLRLRLADSLRTAIMEKELSLPHH